MWPPRSTIRAYGNFVCVEDGELAVVVFQAIWTWQSTSGNDRNDDTVGRIGPSVVKKCIADGEQHSPLVEGIFDLVNLAALLVCGNEVLAPVFNPFDGFAQ